jgi:hypothetical protein
MSVISCAVAVKSTLSLSCSATSFFLSFLADLLGSYLKSRTVNLQALRQYILCSYGWIDSLLLSSSVLEIISDSLEEDDFVKSELVVFSDEFRAAGQDVIRH